MATERTVRQLQAENAALRKELAEYRGHVAVLEDQLEVERSRPVSRPRNDEAMQWVKQYMEDHTGEWVRIISMVDNSAYTHGKIKQRLRWLEQLGLVRVNTDHSPPLFSWIVGHIANA
jgi:hypothetical protein